MLRCLFLRSLFFILVTGIMIPVKGAMAADTDYVGSQQCATCHQAQYQDWQASHHDLAMQEANTKTVLGNFDNTTFRYNGIDSRFYRKGSEFWVKTDGADGQLQDFKITYVFGVTPLQQYLVGFEDGRFQALNIAWDSRPASAGGQRWFHLYPDEKVDHRDVLHWTRFSHNWNNRCADCHSTDLQKHYDVSNNQYNTSWSEIDVACEACHGPGRNHIAWSKDNKGDVSDKGLSIDVTAIGEWRRMEGQSTAALIADKARGEGQLNACGGCHSRRSVLSDAQTRARQSSASPDEYHASYDYHDNYQLSLLEPGLYHADGQILDEVYVYGSFLQSKMYRSGVVCSDCHNPHSLKLKAEGNPLCTRCHNPAQFDSTSHHHHAETSTGALCVNCHMPETTYMVVDPRRDHSLRIPRPDLSEALGAPNACVQCHQTQPLSWAAKHFRNWYPQRSQQPHYGEVLHRGFQAEPRAMSQLANLANDISQAEMVRASALRQLSQYANPYAFNTAMTLLDSSSPLIRRAALLVLADTNPRQALNSVWPLLQDNVQSVRYEAVRLLLISGAAFPDSPINRALSQGQKQQLSVAMQEYARAIGVNADSPGGQIQWGVFKQMQGDLPAAIKAYQQALVIEPDFIPAMINLADIYRVQGDENQGAKFLQRALQVDSDNVSANYSLGLLYIRTGRLAESLGFLEKAANLTTDIAHYRYVYAVALFEAGQAEQAVDLLKAMLKAHPDNEQVRSALVNYLRAMGKLQDAEYFAR